MVESVITGKILIEGKIHCLTGLHIGGNQGVSEIGGVDLLVIRDAASREPYIPGSSLKGKLRSLLEKYHFAKGKLKFNKKMIVGGQSISHHECGESACAICRLFGASRSKDDVVKENLPASLYVRDAYLTEESKDKLLQLESAYYLSEVKFENTLDRITCAANPRQIERVPRGTKFCFQMVYNLWQSKELTQLKEDMEELFTAFRLLNDDYLGGHGSRGYGHIEIKRLTLKWRGLGYYAGEEKEEKEESVEVTGDVGQLIAKIFQYSTGRTSG
jgi:CRISPR-associated protein Csm3